MIWIFYYLLAISVVTVIITIADKLLSKTDKRRVPEKTLLLLGILGGAIAEYVCMKVIRHKTKHKKFMIGLPVIIVLQAALVIFLWSKLPIQ